MTNDLTLGHFVLILCVAVLTIFISKALTQWFHEIPKRNRLLEEIRDELKKLNQEIDPNKE